MNFPVIYGSVRSEREGIRGARFLARTLERRGHEVPFVDPIEYPLPLLDKMYGEYATGTAPEPMQELVQIQERADGFVFVTGEYNHGIPPAMKNLIDHFLETWFWRPAGIASYSTGSFGGVRAAVQLRAVLPEVGLITLPTMVALPKVDQRYEPDGTAKDPAAAEAILTTFIDELEWFAEALKAQRERKGTPY